jgi:glyoxylase-like metal-dependent hydrolase (beta-lactamase superfamily II)
MSDTTDALTHSATSSGVVAPGIHRIEFPFAGRLACCYVLDGEQALVVDTGIAGTPAEHILPYLESARIDPERIRYVLASHADFDHTGGNGPLLEAAPNALLLCHELDRPMIEDADRLFHDRYDEFQEAHGIAESEDTLAWVRENARHVPVDVVLAGGERLRLGPDHVVEVVHTPGHSRGHLSVIDRRNSAAVIADATLSDGIPLLDGAPGVPPTYRFVDTYLATTALLEQTGTDLLLTTHYPVMRGDEARSFLAGSRAYVERVDGVLRELLREAGALSTGELIAAAGPRLGEWPEASYGQLVFPFAGHLERLVTFGLVAHEREADGPRWRWRGAD